MLLGLWLFSQIVTDAYRHTSLENRLRGTAGIVFFGAEIACLAILLGRSDQRKIIFLSAYAAGLIVMARLRPSVLSEIDPWKFGYAAGTIELAVLISSLFFALRKYTISLLLLAWAMGMNLLLNYRSAFLEILVTATLVFPIVPERIGRLRILPHKENLSRVALVTALAIASGWSASKLITLVSHIGLVSQEAQEKNESEAQAGSLLLGGRPEFFTGLKAAIDSPIIGHGSWPRDMKYIEMQSDLMQEYGLKPDLRDAETGERGLIPSHSHVVGAWVWAGILGAVFWVYILGLTVRGIVRVAVARPPIAPVLCWMMVGLFWDNLFSPFGSFQRVYAAISIVLIVDLLDNTRRPLIHRSPQWKRRGPVARTVSVRG